MKIDSIKYFKCNICQANDLALSNDLTQMYPGSKEQILI